MNPEALKELLKQVKYPGFSRDIVSFGLVKSAAVIDGTARIALQVTTADPAIPRQLQAEVGRVVRGAPGVRDVIVDVAVTPPRAAAAPGSAAPGGAPAGIRRTIAVASGKGGVGKSTFAVNLACALAAELAGRGRGAVGLLDCDIYGPSVPLMMGMQDERPLMDEDGQHFLPVEKHGVRVMSMGFLITPDTPVVWRGPMVTSAIRQFVQNVRWGDLAVLVVDLPPGTGDAQLSLVQTIPLDGAIVVTTPQAAATQVARRGATMFEKVNVPLLGVAENMSWFDDGSGRRVALFGEGGGARTARELGTDLIGQVPLAPELREAGDAGAPLVVAQPDHPVAREFTRIARAVLQRLEPATAG